MNVTSVRGETVSGFMRNRGTGARQAPHGSDWPTDSSIEGHRWHPAILLLSFNPNVTYSKMGGKTLSSVALLLPLLTATANAASDPPRPRGVGPDCMSTPSPLKLSARWWVVHTIGREHVQLRDEILTVNSCEILQRCHILFVHFSPIHQTRHLPPQRRLLRLS